MAGTSRWFLRESRGCPPYRTAARATAEHRADQARGAGRARADGGHHEHGVPPAVPRVRRRALRQRDDHEPRARRAHAREHAPHPPPRVRDAAQHPALRGRPEDGRRGGHDARRRGSRRPHRPQLRLPGAEGHPQGRGSGAAVEARPVPRHRRGRRARPRATSRSRSRCARASTPITSPTSRRAAPPRAPASPRIALHARTAAEFYSGTADWSAIAKLKETITSVPVLGNGDIWSADDALRMVDETGCDGVVVGRGCLGRPWLFGDLAAAFRGRGAEGRARPSARSPRAFKRHAELLVEFFDEENRACRDIRKHVAWYFKGYAVGRRAAGGARECVEPRRDRRAARPPRPRRSRTRARTPRVSAAARAPRRCRACPTAGSTAANSQETHRAELTEAELNNSGG